MSLTVTILGCGSSGGVPRVGSGWGACDPADPRNRRLRCSILVERRGAEGTTSLVVDTTPDLREQLLTAGVRRLDAVLYTHEHADHTHGIDDLRPLVIHMRRRIPVYANPPTAELLRLRFGYCFDSPPGSEYPPILDLYEIGLDGPAVVHGPGGTIAAQPVAMEHGSIEALAFRFGGLGYAPDVSRMPETAYAALAGLDTLILDALRYTPHPTHYSVREALAFIEAVAPKRAILTNMHTDLDFERLRRELPPHVEPAYDGLRIEAEADR